MTNPWVVESVPTCEKVTHPKSIENPIKESF